MENIMDISFEINNLDQRKSENSFFSYLKTNVWKLFISNYEVIENDDTDKIVIRIDLVNPFSTKNEDRIIEIIKTVIENNVYKENLYYDLLDKGKNIDIEFANILQEKDEFLTTSFFNEKLIDWIELTTKGLAFSYEIDRNDENQIVFIDFLFESTPFIKKVLDKSETDIKPIFIKGNPKFGKTYTVLYILYKKYCTSDVNILWLKNINNITESSLKEKETLIYVEDPFGGNSYDSHNSEIFLDNFLHRLHTLEKNNSRLFITSRIQNFYLAESDHIHKMEKFIYSVNKFDFMYDTTHEEDNLYSVKNYKKLFYKYALIKGASWIDSYSKYLREKNDNSPWARLNFKSTSPGNIYFLFNLYPVLLEVNKNDSKQINIIIESFNNLENLTNSFYSEINSIIKNIETDSSKKQKIKTLIFILLPALTQVKDKAKVLNDLFNDEKDYINSKYGDLIINRKTSDDNEFYGYFHDSFAEAIHEILKNKGNDIFGKIINDFTLLFTEDYKIEKYSDFIRDFACNYIVYTKDTEHTNEALSFLIKKLSDNNSNTKIDKAIIDTFIVIKDFENEDKEMLDFWNDKYNLDSGNKQSFVKFINITTSIIDRIMNFSLSKNNFEFQKIRFANFYKSFLSYIINKKEIKDKPLLISIFTHTMLMKSEHFAYGKDSRNYLVDIIENHINSVFKLNENNKSKINLLIMWTDAIFMKISELHYYIKHIDRDFDKSKEGIYGDFFDKNKKRVKLAENHIINLECLLRKIVTIVDNLDKNPLKEYYYGGVNFIIFWHNRWAYGDEEGIKNLILNDENLYANKTSNNNFWEGVMFNINYHSLYFSYKLKSWAIEKSIISWAIDKPRIGADHFYESGLNLNILRTYENVNLNELIKSFHSDFFIQTLKNVFLNPLLTIDNKNLENFYSICKLRFPHDDVLYDSFKEKGLRDNEISEDIIKEIMKLKSKM